jgi:murein DD-endopeptidase MepM/ murein hydrolase activator NlpD
VIVRHHNGFETLYGHMSRRLVNVGDLVSAGELVGWGGNTGRSSGPHLHFEVRFKGDAIDPNIMFDFLNDTIRYQTFELSPLHFEYIREMRRRIYHRVRSGDTLFGIAGRYHVSWRQIAKLNRITTKTTLRIGQRLRIR